MPWVLALTNVIGPRSRARDGVEVLEEEWDKLLAVEREDIATNPAMASNNKSTAGRRLRVAASIIVAEFLPTCKNLLHVGTVPRRQDAGTHLCMSHTCL